MNINIVRHSLKRIKLGRILYQSFYKPKAELVYNYNLLLANRGEEQLKNKLLLLEPLQFPFIDISITFLTGKKHWHQTVLCALSLVKVIKHIPSFTIYDDGTLGQEITDLLKKLLPNASIISTQQAEDIVNNSLSRDVYPALRKARDKCIFMRKFIDNNLVSPGSIYLDSDMIFWQYPQELIEYYQNKTPFFMKQNKMPNDLGLICKASIIYETLGIETSQHLNGGIIYLGKINIDWDQVEIWTEKLLKIPNQFNPKHIEQTLYSLLFAQQLENVVGLPDSYYVAFDDDFPENLILSHYVHPLMKCKYMSQEWHRWFYNFN
ncbi:hypothetical protein [Anabaena azotica]|uniref:Glycosyl transferase n=1 Tax=Anabaena azotica FACHB-119 TaxID=947527 RepID=A0ABR8D5U7_9NOST|nr:hypothetical protein [Anabaena azotica]MBD2501516.1 hypothetical protein [Anabaena azotica FACHB-119]